MPERRADHVAQIPAMPSGHSNRFDPHKNIELFEGAPRTCFIVKPCPKGKDTYANLIARTTDLVRSGVVPDCNPDREDAMSAAGGIVGAPNIAIQNRNSAHHIQHFFAKYGYSPA